MRLKQIAVKFLIFTLLLFVFSCNSDKCGHLGPKSQYTGTPPQVSSDPNDMLGGLSRKISGKMFGALFGDRVVDPRFRDNGMIGMRQMNVPTKNAGLASTPEKIDLSEDATRGTVYSMYAGIVRSNEYRATYYLCLILYVVILGLTYLLGMTEMSLQKAIPILVKVGIISLFTNPALSNSTGMPIGWSAYYSIIVAPSLYAMESFAMYFSASLFSIDINNVQDGFAPLSIMFDMLFSGILWQKLITLVFSGFPMGLATCIVMLFAMIMYMISALLAIMGYITIITTLGVLFAIGPIFFIFLLFEKTKTYFDRWWKQIVTLIFQQYVSFIVIAIFGFIIVKSVQAMLSFGVVCKTVIKLKFLHFIEIPVYNHYVANVGDSAKLTMAMYAIFFFMLVSIFAKSITKLSALADGLIEGMSGVSNPIGGLTESLFDKATKTAGGMIGSGVRNAYGAPLQQITKLPAFVGGAKSLLEKEKALLKSDASLGSKIWGTIKNTGSGGQGLAKGLNPFGAGDTNRTAIQKYQDAKNGWSNVGDKKGSEIVTIPPSENISPSENTNKNPSTDGGKNTGGTSGGTPADSSTSTQSQTPYNNTTAQSNTTPEPAPPAPEPTPPAPQNTIRDEDKWVGSERTSVTLSNGQTYNFDPEATVTYFDPNAKVVTAGGQEMTASQYKAQHEGTYDGLFNTDGTEYKGRVVSAGEFYQTILGGDGANADAVLSDITEINGQTYDASKRLDATNLAESLVSSDGNSV